MPQPARAPAALRAALIAAAVACAAVVSRPGDGGGRRVAAQAPLPVTICEIQGDGPATMATTATVTTEGVVTSAAVRVEPYGFTLEAPGCDDRPETSDGLFVYVPRDLSAEVAGRVAVGRRVRVIGRAKEYQGLTELVLDDAQVVDLGPAALPEPAALTLPDDPAAVEAALERYEGMRVSLPPSRAVGGTDAYGEVSVVEATLPLSHVLRGALTGRLATVIAPNDWPVVTQGDTLAGVAGPLFYSYGEYKVVVDDWSTVAVTSGGRRPQRWAEAGPGELTAATFNVENLFDDVDDPGKQDTEGSYFPRTRADYEAFVGHRARAIADQLRWPDIVSIEEVEKLPVLRDLAAHPLLAPGRYDAVLIEGPDPRGIDVGVLYDRAVFALRSVEQRQKCMTAAEAGPAAIAGEACALPGDGPGAASGVPIFARPPLVVRLALRDTDARLTVIANHFKSKGGASEAETMQTRLLQARHVAALVAELGAADPTAPVFVMGDLNEFEDGPPIQELVGDGRLTLLHDRVPAEVNYTYIFNGVAQNLDYILVPPPFATAQVIDAGPVHFNTDFPSRPPADREPPPPPFETSRVSDHDPFAVRFRRWGAPRFAVLLPALLRHEAFPTPAGGDEPTPAAATATPAATAPTGTAPTPAPTAAGATPTTPGGAVPRRPLRIATLFYDGVVPQSEADEYIEIENVAAEAVSLAGWTVASLRGEGQVFAFPAAASIAPGARCRVYTNEDHPERPCAFRWGSDQGIWNNSGDKAELRDPSGAVIDHRCYGAAPWGGLCGEATPTPAP